MTKLTQILIEKKTNSSRIMKLYHYTTIEAFAKIWVSKQLRFSESKNTNDIFEKRKTWEFVCGILPAGEENNIDEAFEIFGKAFSDTLAQYKQISFTRDYKLTDGCKSSMMWGQYAHNENGVCIEFDSELIHFPSNVYRSKVFYSYHVPTIRFDKERAFLDKAYMQKFVKESRKSIFFTKHKCWEHENEFRVITNQHEYLSIDGAITKVFVYDSNSINTSVVEHIINDQVPISYLYINHHNGDRNIGCNSLKAKRELDKRLSEEPDYFTNKEKVRKRFRDFAEKVGFSLEVNNGK